MNIRTALLVAAVALTAIALPACSSSYSPMAVQMGASPLAADGPIPPACSDGQMVCTTGDSGELACRWVPADAPCSPVPDASAQNP